ncbi:MAG: DegT/DnrJ/EryC1/StrS family aminotransferase [Pseudomonadota bacterium]
MSIPFIDLNTQYKKNKSSFDAAISRVLEDGRYIMGPAIQELESELCEYIGVKHALSCSSGTDALVLPLMAKSLGSKDAVFTSPFTFFASAESITLAGATPVFIDINPDTYNLEPELLDPAITKVANDTDLNPRGIVAVDLFGVSADYKQVNQIAAKNDLFVLEDAAQSFGAPYFGKKACALAEVAATSFYPAKPLGCYGDGGALFTDNSDLYEELVSLRVHGQATSGDKYDNVRIGLNARMDTIQAARRSLSS